MPDSCMARDVLDVPPRDIATSPSNGYSPGRLLSSLETGLTYHCESDKRSRGNIHFAGSDEANPKQSL